MRIDAMAVTIRKIAEELESWAPLGTAQSYDNVGLQIGDPDRAVTKGLIALDMTPQVLEEAISISANLIITHHPLLFKPLRALTPSDRVGSLALKTAESGIALYSIHTNLDAAKGGVSHALAEQLGLKEIEFLGGLENSLIKLVVFVPLSHADSVRDAMAAAGAGLIGNYEACSFSMRGTGNFKPSDGADPFIGESGGGLEAVDEIRIETEVSRWSLPRVLAAMKDSHPYDEAAFDVYPVEQPYKSAGIGAIGVLAEPESLAQFLGRVSRLLANSALRYVGSREQRIEKVAVCGGSGSDFIPLALRAGADVYVTADITYHRYFDVLDNSGAARMALVDPGHYESELVAESILESRLKEAFPESDWQRTTTRTAPVETFIADPPV